MRKTTIVADCGHQYNTGWPVPELARATTDCRVCGSLLLFDRVAAPGQRVIHAGLFHVEMNKEWSAWPADGGGTWSASF